MTKDDIIRMALEAGFNEFTGGLRDDGSQDTFLDCWPEQLERFFHMAQAAEREACAKVVENHALGYAEPVWAFKLIDTIRARGQE